MAEQFYTIPTAIGKAKIANSIALGTKVDLKTMKIGDSNGVYYNPSESQTDLVHVVYTCEINNIEIDKKNANWINVVCAIPADVGNFYIREVGIFDADGDLIAIGKYPETYKPLASDGSTKELYIKMTFEVTNASSVTLKIDPTVILATKTDISNLQKEIDNNTAQLSEKEQQLSYIKSNENAILISAFNGINGLNLDLWASKDGIEFKLMNKGIIFTPSTGYMRDPCLQYVNGWYYLIYTTTLPNSKYGFGIAKSQDLINWTDQTFETGYKYTYAPELFIDTDEKTYCNISLGDGTTETDALGNTIPYLQSYLYDVDLTTLSFTNLRQINYSQTSNKIDGSLIKVNDVYHMFVKNEHNRTIEHYTSSIIDASYTFVATMAFPLYVEGCSCVSFNGKYYLYADGFTTNTSWVMTSTDLVTWSKATLMNSNGIRTQHFFPTTVYNKEDINNLTLSDSLIDTPKIIPQVDLSTCISGTTLTIYDVSECYYKYYGTSDVTIDNIIVPNSNKNYKINIEMLVNGANTHILTIKSANNILCPNGETLDLSLNSNNRDTIISLSKIKDHYFRVESNYYKQNSNAILFFVNDFSLNEDNSWTLLAFDNIKSNYNIDILNTNSRFVCKRSGWYQLNCIMNCGYFLVSGARFEVQLRKNGNNEIWFIDGWTPSGNAETYSGSYCMYLYKGDYVELYSKKTTSNPMKIVGNSSTKSTFMIVELK